MALEIQNMFPDLVMHIDKIQNLSLKWNAQHVGGTLLAVKVKLLEAAKAL